MGTTRIAYVDGKVQYGRGKAANVLGQTYNAYRLSSRSNGQLITGQPLYSGFPAKIERLPQRNVAIENSIFELQSYEALCNNLTLNVGDILKEYGYGAPIAPGGGAATPYYAVVSKRPLQPTILIRCETPCAVMHPTPEAGSVSQQPTTGTNQYIPGKYGGNQPSTAQNVVLLNGQYKLDPTYTITPAVVPCGFEAFNRMRQSRGLVMPSEYADTFFCVYVPDLVGYQLVENDELKAPNQDTYICRQVFNTNGVGVAGYLVLVQRKAT